MHSFGNTARRVKLDTGVEGERVWMVQRTSKDI
jgi:hypothetical protein